MHDDSDNSYPQEWRDCPEPSPLDPVFGGALDPWRPTYSELANLANLAQAYVSRDLTFGSEWLDLCRNRDRFPSYILGLLEIMRTQLVGASGQDLAATRLGAESLNYRQQHLEGKVNERGD